MAALTDRVNVGTAVLVTNEENQVLLGKRLSNKHGKDTYSPPGGKPDPGEDPAFGAVRELYEETGLSPWNFGNPQHSSYERWESEGIHYVTIYYTADCYDEDAVRNPEPDKCEGWDWYDTDALPEPLFPGVREAIATVVG